jgi:ribose 5-phosphate isomerase B
MALLYLCASIVETMATKLVIGSDHAGYALKEKVKQFISNHFELDIHDVGTYSEESTDYPDYAHEAANLVAADLDNTIGVLICGSGNGISMAANKHADIRCALSWLPEIAELARLHNNANIVSLPARFISEEMAFDIVKTFLTTPFEGGRHERRVNKIACV